MAAPIIHDSTIGMLSLALNASNMRQQAIANNIANANTPGYQRIGVNFESRMSEVKSGLRDGRTPALADLQYYQPLFEAAPDSIAGDPVQLDMEVAGLSENTLHQQALIKALNKHLSILSTAINEGKR
ncbi:flagellar basal body rod protein FlgB [Janthinobacterium sp. GB4P2]|uniref:flagellar basal body rod protein FlgB n=1 Tax=Janthinobacterium sp. GB4P2 TaxID=3424189 RepID=UPI003F522010